LSLEADLAGKMRGFRVVQTQLPFLEAEVEVDQKECHEKVEEAQEMPHCCWRATAKQRQMCE
jgi:hypothetical protein